MKNQNLIDAAQSACNALVSNAMTFNNYAALHHRKNTPDSDRKAAANTAHAASCMDKAAALQAVIDAARASEPGQGSFAPSAPDLEGVSA